MIISTQWSVDFHTLLCFCKLDGYRPPKFADKPSDENLTGWREVKLSAGFFPFPSLRLDAGQAARHWPHLDEYAARHKRAKERDGRSGRARKGALPIRSLALHTLSDDVEITAPNHQASVFKPFPPHPLRGKSPLEQQLDTGHATNRMNFWKSSKGGGHFQSKNLYCRFWEL